MDYLNIGTKIKSLRAKKHITLKELSNKTNLSTGFLSQLERGMSTIAIDTLEIIASTLDVDIFYFLSYNSNSSNPIIRSYERKIFQMDSSECIQYALSNDPKDKKILPRIFEIMPSTTKKKITEYSHHGEEFIYVLEGILTISLKGKQETLYPGDCIHFNSSKSHNLANLTNMITKILLINAPNPFSEK